MLLLSCSWMCALKCAHTTRESGSGWVTAFYWNISLSNENERGCVNACIRNTATKPELSPDRHRLYIAVYLPISHKWGSIRTTRSHSLTYGFPNVIHASRLATRNGLTVCVALEIAPPKVHWHNWRCFSNVYMICIDQGFQSTKPNTSHKLTHSSMTEVTNVANIRCVCVFVCWVIWRCLLGGLPCV